MNNDVYLIQESVYAAHIEAQVKMFELFLSAVHDIRGQLMKGRKLKAMRILSDYEHKAHEMFAGWNIPDSYFLFHDPDFLTELMNAELLSSEQETEAES